jgi:nucleoid-associated protein YgaU
MELGFFTKALNLRRPSINAIDQTLLQHLVRLKIADSATPQFRGVALSVQKQKESDMGFFSTILEKLGFGVAKAEAATAAAPAEAATSAAPAPMAAVDVVAQLEQRAAANPQKLNWRTSIVDLLKLLEIDSSLAARKELATELGCPADLMGDSAKMNMWLHKTVLARIAANGGNIPKELLD